MNGLSPIGDTGIGVQGKKKRSLVNGDNKAIPRPPSVNASNMPWLAPMIKKNRTYLHHSFENSDTPISQRKFLFGE